MATPIYSKRKVKISHNENLESVSYLRLLCFLLLYFYALNKIIFQKKIQIVHQLLKQLILG